MKVTEIYFDDGFEKEFKKLPLEIKKKAVKAENLFRENPFHPSLRLHQLKGKLKPAWSISIDQKYRIIFLAMEDGKFLFVSVGTHAIYVR